jgi:hypothetical protein
VEFSGLAGEFCRLGLFDRPAEEKALRVLLKPPAIRGLTESLTNLRPTEWRTILAKLRRAKLLAGEDPQYRGYLDTHPLVREYFGEQLRTQRREAWQECNRRLLGEFETAWQYARRGVQLWRSGPTPAEDVADPAVGF